MIPLHDDQPTRRTPVVTLLLIAANVLVFVGWQLEVGLPRSVAIGGLVPAELTGTLSPDAMRDVFSSMFMHGGWMHLIGNMWFLWLFGNNVEDQTGRFRFPLFYLLCGIAADAVYIFFEPGSTIPLIGASGAVSGVLGAYLWLHPRARVMTLIPLGILTRVIYVPAFLFLLIWMGFQILSQFLIATGPGRQGGGVAYTAHIGGFVAGLILIHLFKSRQQSRGWRR